MGERRPRLEARPPGQHLGRSARGTCRRAVVQRDAYSHSIVAGGFELTSYTTRFTPFTSLLTRLEIRPSTSGGKLNQSAVIPSRLVTARSATTCSSVRPSPIPP